MATILVDYENVNAANGLKVVEYLSESDTLYIFYSQCCGKIRYDHMEAIEKSGCMFKTYKLVKTGKNALDFYIASECGAICQRGETQIAIVSNDKGFTAVADFIKIKEDVQETTVVTAQNIETALISLNDADRRKMLQQKSKMLDIAASQAWLEERKAFRKKLKDVLKAEGYGHMYPRILSYIEDNREASAKVLYTGSLHQFGRDDGVKIYQILKKVV